MQVAGMRPFCRGEDRKRRSLDKEKRNLAKLRRSGYDQELHTYEISVLKNRVTGREKECMRKCQFHKLNTYIRGRKEG